MWVFPSLYTGPCGTDPYGPYETRRIHLWVLASMWPEYTRTSTGRPYSSDRKWVILYGLPTGLVRTAFQAAHRNRRFEAYSCMCRRPLHELYQNLYINYASILELASQPTSNSRGKTCPVIGLLSNLTASKGKYWPSDSLSFSLFFIFMYM